MDLFHGYKTQEDGPWIEIKDKHYPDKRTKVKVKLANDNETFAYYYDDLSTHFWECTTRDPLSNVTHWKALKE